MTNTLKNIIVIEDTIYKHTIDLRNAMQVMDYDAYSFHWFNIAELKLALAIAIQEYNLEQKGVSSHA